MTGPMVSLQGSISLEVPAHVLSLRYAEETPDDEESADPAEVPQLVSPEGTVSQEEPSPPDAAADAGKRAEGCTAADDDASTTAAEVRPLCMPTLWRRSGDCASMCNLTSHKRIS